MFPLQAAYPCQSLPHVNGPTVSEYYGLIRLPTVIGFPTCRFGSAYLYAFCGGQHQCTKVRNQSGLPSSCRSSPRMPRSSWTPADPREPHQRGSSVWASGPLTPSPSASSSITGLYQDFRECGLPCGLRGSLCMLQLFRSASSPPRQLQHSVWVVG